MKRVDIHSKDSRGPFDRRIAVLAASALAVPALAIGGAGPAAAACGTNTYSGGAGTSGDPYIIDGTDDLTVLSDASGDWGCAFRQAGDITFSSGEWSTSIGDSGDNFTGSYDGDGFTISGLTISRAGESDVGLFGWVSGGEISNVNFEGSVVGQGNVGGLVGIAVSSTITGSSSSGSVQGSDDYVGGLVGYADVVIVNDSESSATVSVPQQTAAFYVGGLIGYALNVSIADSSASGNVTAGGSLYVGGAVGSMTGELNRVTATGNVEGGILVGGLAGIAESSTEAVRVSATGSVRGREVVGGLVGGDNGTIDQGFSSGQVTAVNGDALEVAGGLVGITSGGSITNSYSISDVTAPDASGGLIGSTSNSVTNSYSVGSVAGAERYGGLVGLGEAELITGSFWDTQTSGQATSGGGTGKTTEEMKDIATFSGASWDIASGSGTSSIWGICPAVNSGYPFLTWLYSADACGTPPTPKVQFTFSLPDGQECSMISPVQVVKGSWYALPGADADCRSMDGSTIVGWTVPGSTRVFAPEAEVNATGSQRFIAVLREPIVTVRYDANVGDDVACLRDGENLEERVDTVRLTRDQVGSVALASGAICTPAGHRLAGWTWRTSPGQTIFDPGAESPDEWNAHGSAPVNSVDLYAIWAPDVS